jgi:hypothetical protein
MGFMRRAPNVSAYRRHVRINPVLTLFVNGGGADRLSEGTSPINELQLRVLDLTGGAFLEVVSLLLMVVRQRSFFLFRNGDGVKEGLRRRLAETPAALMWPFLIVTSDPFAEIVLQLFDRGGVLLAEGDAGSRHGRAARLFFAGKDEPHRLFEFQRARRQNHSRH